jgi:integrase
MATLGERPRRRGEGRIFRRGTMWWIAYCCRLDGKVREVRESAATEDKAKAWARLDERVQKARSPKSDFDPRAERLTVDDLADAFERDYKVNRRRSFQHATHNADRLRAYFGGRRAVDIDADQVQAYTDLRLDEGAKPATINRELAALKRMFTLAVATRKGFHYRPYIPLLTEENAREGFLEPADFETVRHHLPADLADLATFAYLTGWRRGEVLTLEWRDVTLERTRQGDIVGGTIRLRAQHSKNKRPRVSALRGELLEVLQRRVVARRLDCAQVFHRDGKAVRSFRTAWAIACETAGIPGLLFHDLRRSAVRNMVRAGVPERVAMRISGHRTRSVFDRYDITSETDLEAAAEQTSRYVAEKRTDAPRVLALTAGRGHVSDNLSDNDRSRDAALVVSH